MTEIAVRVISEGPSKTAPGKECIVFRGSDADWVQRAFEEEAERRAGCSEAMPAGGPTPDGAGGFVLYARMPIISHSAAEAEEATSA